MQGISMAYTIGSDYGINSFRCLIIDVSSGLELKPADYINGFKVTSFSNNLKNRRTQ